MEKKIKRLAALFAACALALVLFGCKHSSGGGDDDWVAPLDIAMVEVKGGTVVGAKNENNYAGVFIEGRTVTLSSFYIGKYEVTQEEYSAVMAGQKFTCEGLEIPVMSDPSICKADSESYVIAEGEKQEKRPVEGVTWYDAVYFCNVLSQRNGYTPAYEITVKSFDYISGSGPYITDADVTLVKGANGYRLPTEAEWEYAARGGNPSDTTNWNYLFSGAPSSKENNTTYSSWWNSGMDAVGWYDYNTCNSDGKTGDTGATKGTAGYGTHEVGKNKAANKLGLYDMSGNVFEWCWDWYNYTVDTGTATDPKGATSGKSRVCRGGDWLNGASFCSVAYRFFGAPSNRSSLIGFRVVRSAN